MRHPDERRASSRLVGSGVLARVRRLPAALEVRAGEGVRGGGEDILEAIRTEKALTDEIKSKLKEAIDTYAKTFA